MLGALRGDGIGRARRVAARACLAGAAGLALFALVGPVAGQASTSRPPVYKGVAAASAIHEEENGEAGVGPVYQPFYGTVADAYTVYADSGVLARASTFFPGATVGNPNSLLCQINCFPIPAYPLSVQTTGSPPQVSESVSQQVGGPGQPLSVTAADAVAKASQTTGTDATAVDAAFSAPGTTAGTAGTASAAGDPPATVAKRVAEAVASFRTEVAAVLGERTATASGGGSSGGGSSGGGSSGGGSSGGGSSGGGSSGGSQAVVAVSSLSAATSQHFVGGRLETSAVAHLGGVSLLDGLVHIGSITASATSSSDGAPAVGKAVDHVSVTDVTVDGLPATISRDGISLAGTSTGSAVVDTLNSALQQALAAAGAEIRLVGVTSSPAQPLDGCPGTEADGVLLHVQANLSEAPVVGDVYYGDYSLGAACASDLVRDLGTTASGTQASSGATGGTSATGPAVSGSPGVSAALPASSGFGGSSQGSGASLGSPTSPLASAVGSPARTVPASAPPALMRARSVHASLADTVVAHRVAILYLAMTLAFLAVVLGTKLFLPAGWPGKGRAA
jgi:hypothetical protein